MKLSEYLALDGLGLRDLIERGEVSPVEPSAAALEAINLFEPHVGALVECYRDRADAGYVNSLPDGPLKGVPTLFKDLVCHEAGQKYESGSRLAKGLTVPTATDLADRFAAAGFVNLGRSKTPEMGFNLTTETLADGPVHNPWKEGVSAGGSSGGAGAAVAAGMVPIAHANDGGGSIRIPAAACGVIGLKPTRGRVPIGPDAGEGLNGLGIELAITRTVRDMAAVLDAVEGPGVGDPYEIARPGMAYAEAIEQGPGKLRVGLWRTPPSADGPTPEVLDALDKAAALLAQLGHEVEEAGVDLNVSWDAFIEANGRVWCANIAHWVDAIVAAAGRTPSPDTLEHTTLACVEYGRSLEAGALLQAFDVFNLASRAFGRLYERYDILLSPTLPRPPVPHGVYDANAEGLTGPDWTARIFEATPFTCIYNVTGLPAISLPMGWSESLDLPIGLQFGAGFGREDRLLQLAAELERAEAWTVRYPPRLMSLIE